MKKNLPIVLAALTFNVYSPTALSHATLETKSVTANSTYKAVVRISHGCEGSDTTTVTVKIPEGVIKVKPKALAGWNVSMNNVAYEKTYEYYGKEVTEGATEVVWQGGKLPHNFYEEFIFRARITDAFKAGDIIHFPTIQTCETGANNWIEIPAAGQDPHDLKRPAPSLKVLEPKHQHHH